jgi:hypothetical protein
MEDRPFIVASVNYFKALNMIMLMLLFFHAIKAIVFKALASFLVASILNLSSTLTFAKNCAMHGIPLFAFLRKR